MNLIGPQTYRLQNSRIRYAVVSPEGVEHFTKPATEPIPKLYAISKDNALLYIGVTKQPLASRFRGGMNATGEHGYHGYSWRRIEGVLRLDVWCLEGSSDESSSRELETIEAETVLLFRNEHGQWPDEQTEIHFHPSNEFHRDCARQIINSIVNNHAG